MKNRARIPYHARRKVYRWTRPPAPKLEEPLAPVTCGNGKHIWVFKGDEPQRGEKCLCGKYDYREMLDA